MPNPKESASGELKRKKWKRSWAAASPITRATFFVTCVAAGSTFLYTFVASWQLAVMKASSASSTTQGDALIRASEKSAAAAEKFAVNAEKINTGLNNAVTKLGDQVAQTEKSRISAEGSTQKQMFLLRSQFQMDERPIIDLVDSSADPYPPVAVSADGKNGILQGTLVVGMAIKGKLSYVNSGKFPATRIRILRHIVFSNDPPLDQFHPDSFDENAMTSVFPNRPEGVELYSVLKEDGDPGSRPQLANLQPWSGTLIWVFGEIVYYDRFKNKYCTPFLYEFNGNWVTPAHIWNHVTGVTRNINDFCPKDSIL